MSEKDRISQPSSGSEKLGSETQEKRGSGMPAGTDTQTKLAALSTQKDKDVHDDEKVVKNKEGKNVFPGSEATDE